MTQFLASVRSADEAEIALRAGADIIDLKEPDQGALGAVAPAVLRQTVAKIAGHAPLSATVGDLPMQPALLREAIAATAASGVDYVKFGVFSQGDPQACFQALELPANGAGLIAVLFADDLPEFDAIALATKAGLTGIMLDTKDKQSGNLLTHLDAAALARFVDEARKSGLLVGLAGSLRKEHVAPLLALSPDLLGFRGALCEAALRGGSLNERLAGEVRSLIPREPLGAHSVTPAIPAESATSLY